MDAVQQVASQSEALSGETAANLARHYIRVKTAAETLAEIAKTLNATRDKLKGELVPAAFEREELTTTTLKEGFRVTISLLTRASIKPDSKLKVWHAVGDDRQGWLSEKDARDTIVDADVIDGPGGGVYFKEYTGKEAAYWWLRCNQLGDLITEKVESSTLSAAAKKRMEDGFEMPAELFDVALMPNTSVTAVKAKP